MIIDLIRRLRGERRTTPIKEEAAAALEKALDFKTETLKLLKKIEWSATERGPGWGYMGSGGDGPSYAACPSCGGLEKSNPDFDKRRVGHRPRCKIKPLLDKAEDFEKS